MSSIFQPQVSQQAEDARAGVIANVSDATIASASTVDLTVVKGYQIEVTGTNPIDTITMDEGDERVLVCADGLTFEAGSDLLTKGGVDAIMPASAWVIVRGRSAGVVAVIDQMTTIGYSSLTIKDIFMMPGGRIAYADLSSPFFDVGRSNDSGSNGNFIRLTLDDYFALYKHDLSASVGFDTNGLTGQRVVNVPNKDGTFVYQDDLLQPLPISVMSAKASDEEAIIPILVFAKSVTVLTAGAPADIAEIDVPFPRWRAVASATTAVTSTIVQETLSGTNTTAQFQAWSGAGGTGSQIMANILGQSTAPTAAGWPTTGIVMYTSSKIYIRQSIASLFGGTVSFYIYVMPLPGP